MFWLLGEMLIASKKKSGPDFLLKMGIELIVRENGEGKSLWECFHFKLFIL